MWKPCLPAALIYFFLLFKTGIQTQPCIRSGINAEALLDADFSITKMNVDQSPLASTFETFFSKGMSIIVKDAAPNFQS